MHHFHHYPHPRGIPRGFECNSLSPPYLEMDNAEVLVCEDQHSSEVVPSAPSTSPATHTLYLGCSPVQNLKHRRRQLHVCSHAIFSRNAWCGESHERADTNRVRHGGECTDWKFHTAPSPERPWRIVVQRDIFAYFQVIWSSHRSAQIAESHRLRRLQLRVYAIANTYMSLAWFPVQRVLCWSTQRITDIGRLFGLAMDFIANVEQRYLINGAFLRMPSLGWGLPGDPQTLPEQASTSLLPASWQPTIVYRGKHGQLSFNNRHHYCCAASTRMSVPESPAYGHFRAQPKVLDEWRGPQIRNQICRRTSRGYTRD